MTFCFFFFFNDTATTEIYTLSLHDALPILPDSARLWGGGNEGTKRWFSLERVMIAARCCGAAERLIELARSDRKSTRLNSSHANISYAVFCLKKKKKK